MRPVTNITTARLIEAGSRAADWVSARLRPDGSFPGVENEIEAYYKMPVFFALSGRPVEAAAVVGYLRERFFDAGDFHTGTDDTVLSFRNYRNAWIARGLHMLGFYDLSRAAGDYLEAEMVPDFGGLVTEPGAPGVKAMDWGSTCSAAKAFLTMGRMTAAVRCGEYLVDSLERQPEPDRFLLKRDLGGAFLDEEDQTFVIELERPGQIYFPLGIGMVVFAGLAASTGESKWLSAAQKVYAAVGRSHDELFGVITNRKVAWGAAELFSVTGDSAYAEMSARIWSWTLETQTPEGIWLRHPEYASLDEQPRDLTVDATVESGLYMFELARTLAPWLPRSA